jgi:hypothetical protein
LAHHKIKVERARLARRFELRGVDERIVDDDQFGAKALLKLNTQIIASSPTKRVPPQQGHARHAERLAGRFLRATDLFGLTRPHE